MIHCSKRYRMNVMKPIMTILFILAAVAGMAQCYQTANAHDWYPIECCSGTDCAPVEGIARHVPTGGGIPQMVVTSKHGTAIIPQDFRAGESKDQRMHVCMRQSEIGTWDVMCLFFPPHM